MISRNFWASIWLENYSTLNKAVISVTLTDTESSEWTMHYIKINWKNSILNIHT
jgi:hypothetical protein